MTELKVTEGSSNIFADLGFDVQQSQNLLLRSQTMIALAHWFKASGLTQTEAASQDSWRYPASVQSAAKRQN